MIAARVVRGEQQEDKVDGLVVVRLVVDRLFQAREQTQNVAQPGKFDMRNGDATAKPGRAEALTLQQRVEYLALIETGALGGDCRQFLQSVLLARCLERHNYAVGSQQVAEIHLQILFQPDSIESRPAGS